MRRMKMLVFIIFCLLLPPNPYEAIKMIANKKRLLNCCNYEQKLPLLVSFKKTETNDSVETCVYIIFFGI